MPISKKSRNIFRFVFKLLTVTAILYLGLTLFVTNTWEPTTIDSWLLDNQQNINTWEITEIIDLEIHPSADTSYKRKFQYICMENLATCIKIDFDGEFNDKDKYMYLASIIFVTRFMDKYSNTELSTNTALKEIKLKKNGGDRRWYATKEKIEINIDLLDSYTEFLNIITHELGHIYALSMIQWSNKQLDPYYTEFGKPYFPKDHEAINYFQYSRLKENISKSSARKDDFCSGYGKTNIHEDFAECFVTYIMHHDLFAYRAQNDDIMAKKYNFFNKQFDGNFLFHGSSDLSRARANNSKRPWDATKLGE